MKFLSLDVRTVLILLVIGNLAAGALLLVYRRSVPPSPPLRRYLAGALAQAVAWSLLALRNVWPDFLSIYVGNVILLMSFNLECLAFASIEARPKRVEWLFAALATTGIAIFLLVSPAPNLRIVAASVATMLPYGALAVIFLASRGRDALRLSVGIATALFVPVLVFRCFVAIGRGASFGLMTPDVAQDLAFLVPFLFAFAGCIAFILLLKQKSDSLLAESEEKYRSLVERATEAIVIAQDEVLDFANPRAAVMVGRREEDLVGARLTDFVWPEDVGLVRSRFLARVAGGSLPDCYDFRLLHADGTPRWVSLSSAVIRWKGRLATLTLLTDIDERKKAEDRASRLLSEKELLLREVHHRIKNNLQVATGLLSLQADRTEGRDAASVLRDAESRLQVLAELYDLLHTTGSFTEVSMRDFLGELARRAVSVFPGSQSVGLDLEVEDIVVDAGRLATIGIIVNEIVTNSMKHAFGGMEDPRIRIAVSREGSRIRLVCGDNGRGLPPGFDPAASGGLGLQLIPMLASQLGAALAVGGEAGPGTSYRLEFDEQRKA